MTIAELSRYLPYAPNQNEEMVLLDRKTYDRLLRKAKKLDEILKHLRGIYYKNIEK